MDVVPAHWDAFLSHRWDGKVDGAQLHAKSVYAVFMMQGRRAFLDIFDLKTTTDDELEGAIKNSNAFLIIVTPGVRWFVPDYC
jgi:hypothetical protein